MKTSEVTTEIDYLALALTRSPMFMGVNMRSFFANIVLCTLICINAHTLLCIPLIILIHLLMVRLSIKEPDFLYINIKSFIKTPPVLNYWYWGKTNSYEPW
ncbi:MAG: VirB3 family type IV secretion system protein [Gammaproteobacteria bacterium]